MQMQAVSKLTSQPQNPISLRLSPGHRVNTHACSHLQGAQQRPCRVKPQTSVSQVHVGASATQPTSPAPVSPVQQASTQHKWKWGKHTINYVTAGCGAPVILVHGFGLSSGHYRKNIVELAKTNKVYAIDLLGFGASDKPVMQYTIELWGAQILAFMAEFTGGTGAVLVGNSIGSLAALVAAAEAPPGAVKGLVSRAAEQTLRHWTGLSAN